MKNKNNLFIKIFMMSVLFIMPMILKVNATTGGETFIYDFKYNNTDESVYYTQKDLSGRGCPPELVKISLKTEKNTIVYSCEKGESVSLGQVDVAIDAITKNLEPLTSLNLKKNNISIDVNFVKIETYDANSSEILMRHFVAEIYQNNKKIKEIPITGCNIDQPFIFQGFSIPGFDKKIVILLSTKGNCNEGGYIKESLYVVGGVDDLDKVSSTNFHKTASALTPNEDSLVVYESDKNSNVIVATTTNSTTTASTASTIMEKSAIRLFFESILNWFKNLF